MGFLDPQFTAQGSGKLFRNHEIVVPDNILPDVKNLIEYQRGIARYANERDAREAKGEKYTVFEHLYDSNLISFERLILPNLPANATKLVDIGCGLAMYDIFVYRHYKKLGQEITMYHLVDQTRYRYGFQNDTYEFYNNLEWAREIAIHNGVPSLAIETTVNATKENISKLHDIDFVSSMVSWGFHYPISVYLTVVFEALKAGGILSLEVRKNRKSKDRALKNLEKQFGEGNCKVVDKMELRAIAQLICIKQKQF